MVAILDKRYRIIILITILLLMTTNLVIAEPLLWWEPPPWSFREVDSDPTVYYPWETVVPNGSLSNSGGSITLDFNVLYPLRTEWLQNGFPNRTDSSLSFTNGSLTFSIQPTVTSFDYFDDGVKYTSTGDTIIIANTEGLHLFYYSGSTLTTIANPSDAQIETATLSDCLVAYIYWDATNSLSELIEDRHGISMSPNTHRELHFTAGTTFFDGLALGDFVISDGVDNEDAQFSIATGSIFDEDIKHITNTLSKTTGAEVWYRNASLDWRKDTQAGFSVLNATNGRVQYDNNGTLTEVTDGRWVLYHIFATSFADLNPISIMGQAQYSTAKAARIGATTEINALLLGALPSEEMKAIGTVIFQTKDTYGNSVKAKVVQTDEGDNYVDWRLAKISPSAAAEEHGALAGLTDDDHLQYLLADGTRALTGDWNVGAFDITAVDITATGTLEGATLTEGGVAVINATEGGAWTGTEDFGGATVELPNSTTDTALANAGEININVTDDQISVHMGATGEAQGEVAISVLKHITLTFDPAGWYDQESTYRVVPVMYVGDDLIEGFTMTEWKVAYVGGDPTTELTASLCYDTSPDFNPAAENTDFFVMDVITTSAGASTADTGFDIALAPNGSQMYIFLQADPTDANVVVAVDIWGYAEED